MTSTRAQRVFDGIILVLSVYVVGELLLEIVSEWSESTLRIIQHVDFAICLIFLADWGYFLWKAEDKKAYFWSRLPDLISSIPFEHMLRPFRIIRIARMYRGLRLFRALKGIFPILHVITKSKRRSALSIYLSATMVVYLYCVLGIFNFERGINEKIPTFADALWLGFTTLTTIGYGDIYPVTIEGKIMAGILAVTGMGLFSLITAGIASLLVEASRNEQPGE